MSLRDGFRQNLLRPRAGFPHEERRPGHAGMPWAALEPHVRAIAREQTRRRGIAREDAEDIAGDACLRLLQLSRSSAAREITNLDAYIRRVVDNLCTEQIRQDKPEWTHLKTAIVAILRGRRGVADLTMWRAGSGAVGGYAAWCGRDVEWTPRYAECQHDTRALCCHLQTVAGHGEPDLAGLLAGILDWVATPVPLNVLTFFVFEARGLKERQWEPMEETERCMPDGCGMEKEILRRLLVRDIAPAFLYLPPRECAAFLMHLEPEVAERLLIAAKAGGPDGAATSIARRLGMTSEDLEHALDEVPWCDLRIADLLGITGSTPRACQQAVINLRQRAVRQMRRSVGDAGAARKTAR